MLPRAGLFLRLATEEMLEKNKKIKKILFPTLPLFEQWQDRG